LNGETIVLDTNNPSLGFNPYNTVYNIYPVNGNGEYCPEGEVTVIRKTANQLSGFILAPKGMTVIFNARFIICTFWLISLFKQFTLLMAVLVALLVLLLA
jgi:hypothetical protein